MNSETRLSLPTLRVVVGLSLVSLGLIATLAVAASPQITDVLVLGVRLFVHASDAIVGLLSHSLGPVVLAVLASWALLGCAGVWILWRMTHPDTDVTPSHEVTHES